MSSKKLDSIQLLRGVAVLIVIAFHFRKDLNGVYAQVDLGDRLFNLGEMGVDIFFIISGFIIVYSSKNAQTNSALEFLIKRFFRLYPVYIFSLIFILLLDYSATYSYSKIIKSFLLIPNDYNQLGPWYGYSINMPAWTLTYEVLFYILFAFSIFISHKHRSLISIGIMISLCCASQLYFRGFLQVDPLTRDPQSHNVVNNIVFISNPIIYDFIFGIILGELYIKFNASLSNATWLKLVLVIAFISAGLLMFTGYHRGAGIERWGLMSFVLVGSLLFLERIILFNCSKILLYLGEISYSLYINHMIVRKLSGLYLKDSGIYNAKGGFTLFIFLVGLTLVISMVTYNLIEKPSIKIGRALAKAVMKKRYTGFN